MKVSKNYVEVLKQINANFKNRPDLLRKYLLRLDHLDGRPLQKKGDRRNIVLLWDSIKNYPFHLKKIASLVLIVLKIKL